MRSLLFLALAALFPNRCHIIYSPYYDGDCDYVSVCVHIPMYSLYVLEGKKYVWSMLRLLLFKSPLMRMLFSQPTGLRC